MNQLEHEEKAVEQQEKEMGSQRFIDLQQLLSKIEKPEEKLPHVMAFMESTLSQAGIPDFKGFWDSRTLCLELFKQQISPALRALMWEKYSDLSKEARRLKEIFDQKSAFAMEQIGVAIQALEEDVKNAEQRIADSSLFSFPIASKFLEKNEKGYCEKQRELNFYHAIATQVSGLRKELIKTDMRIRYKNQFFQRLSLLGDQIFPKRKELIQQVSRLFLSDVARFAEEAFSEDKALFPHFVIREEVKALQLAAKKLTLNTGCFNQTRKILSQAWDELKKLDKEFRKERAEKKGLFEENASLIHGMITLFEGELEAAALSTVQAKEKFAEITRKMRDVELGRDEVKLLQEKLTQVKKLLRELSEGEELKRKQIALEEKQSLEDCIQGIRRKIISLEEKSDQESPEVLSQSLEEIIALLAHSGLREKEIQELQEELVPVQDLIEDKREELLLLLAAQDRKKMREVLEMRRKRRQQIKLQAENVRRALSLSGLDFEQSLRYNELLNRHKERLAGLDLSIEKLERESKG